jgi:ABC-2 type transport system permease protein
MVRLQPGGVPWLLAHELRLVWRGSGGARTWLLLLFGGVLWAAVHLVAWAVLTGWTRQGGQLTGSMLLLGGTLTWVLLSLMLSSAMTLSVNALFTRDDLDLLLSSPIPVDTVFWVRGLGIALSCSAIWLLLLSPFAHVGLVLGRPSLLAIYPVLLAMGLLMAGLGMSLTLALVRWLGARRARVVAQLLGAFTGAAIFLALQAHNLMPEAARQAIAAWAQRTTQPGGWLAAGSALWLPFRALLGEGWPAVGVCAMALGGFWLAVRLTRSSFIAGWQQAAGVAGGAAPAGGRAPGFHRPLLANVLVKEWRQLLRDPNQIARVVLQLLYMLPLLFVVGRKDGAEAVAASALVLMAASLTGLLGWLTVAAEDAPELLGSAPVSLARLRWYKVVAALVPVWLLLLLPLLACLWWRPWDALVLLPCLLGSTLCASVVYVWFPRQGRRQDVKQRRGPSLLQGLLEAFASFAWAGTAYVAPRLPWLLLLTVPLALAGPLGAWLGGRRARAAEL